MKQSLMPAGQSEVVLRPSRWKLIAQSAGALAFVAVGVVAISKGAGLGGVLATLFFGLCGVVFLVQLAPGASFLRITREGFSFCALLRKSVFMKWSEVSDFRVASVPPFGRKMVVFDVGSSSKRGLKAVNRALVGAGAALPDTYGMTAQELVELLNARKSCAHPSG